MLVRSLLFIFIYLFFQNVMATTIESRLKPCPDKPNCVSSLSTNSDQLIKPISFQGSTAEAISKLKHTVSSFSRTRLLQEQGEYLHFTFTSLIFRFVDDVEFVIDEANQVIHVRSASRVGYSDMGVNRRRVEEIRDRFRNNK